MSHRNLKDKLKQFDSHLVDKQKKTQKINSNIPQRYLKLAEFLEGELISNFAGAYCLVKKSYPLTHTHGTYKVKDYKQFEQIPLAAFSPKNIEGSVNINSLLFFDTETTGLGGSGAVAFLVGCGFVIDDKFEIRQYLIPDYSDETAMLETLLEEFTPDKNLVSFNGTSFDLPLLRDRMIINRVAKEIKHENHLDLLHTNRRIFKRRLKDCTLVNLEKELFNFFRKDDIPGYLIPSVYFEWLSDENPELLKDVMIHNRFDILSMYYMVCHIVEIFNSEGKSLGEIDDLHSLSRIYGKRKEIDKSLSVYNQITEFNKNLASDILFFHSLSFKRKKEFESAVEIWKNLSLGNDKESYLSCLELSKFYEHRNKDYQTAIMYAEQAFKNCPPSKNLETELKKRLSRLQNKLK